MADKSPLEVLGKALASLGLHLPDLKFVQRDSLRAPVQPVTIHEIDRTPILSERGGGEARIRAQCSDSVGVDIGGWAPTAA